MTDQEQVNFVGRAGWRYQTYVVVCEVCHKSVGGGWEFKSPNHRNNLWTCNDCFVEVTSSAVSAALETHVSLNNAIEAAKDLYDPKEVNPKKK